MATIALAAALAGPPAPAAAVDLLRVEVEDGTLIVTGTDARDEVYFECHVQYDCVVHARDPIDAGPGCSLGSSTTAYCDRRAATDGSFVMAADGGGGDDEIRHAYSSCCSDYDPAFIAGGPGNDFIGGGAGVDVIEGGPGDDTLDGQRGDDFVVGGSLEPAPGEDPGSDVVAGGWGSDLLTDGDSLPPGLAAPGPDVISGGSCEAQNCRDEDKDEGDFDVVDLSSRTDPVTVSLGGAGPEQGAVGEGDTYELLDGVFGGSGEDELAGSNGDNLLDGGPGSDSLAGIDGDDLLIGGSLDGGADGSDLLHGGSGHDEISYADRTGGVTVDLGRIGAQGAENEDDMAHEFEAASGGDGADLLVGSDVPDHLFGLGGDDRIEAGGGGADRVDCGDGTDVAAVDEADDATGCEPPALLHTVVTGGGESTRPPASSPPAPSPAPPLHEWVPLGAELVGPALSPRVRVDRRGRGVLRAHTVRCPNGPLLYCRTTVSARYRGREVGRWKADVSSGGQATPRLRVRRGELRRLRRARRPQLVVLVTIVDERGPATHPLRVPIALR